MPGLFFLIKIKTMKIYNDVTGIIGGTPMIRLNKLSAGIDANIYLKMENQNPGGSVKDHLTKGLIWDTKKNFH
jgi:cysteine synthase